MKLSYTTQSAATPAISDLVLFVVSCRFLAIPMLLRDIVLVQGELCRYCQFYKDHLASFCSKEANKPANSKQTYVPAAVINTFPSLPRL